MIELLGVDLPWQDRAKALRLPMTNAAPLPLRILNGHWKRRKKLREARFFLDKMNEQERLAFGDKEPFDNYLSAFLNATRTVDYRLRHEQPTTYRSWRRNWDDNLRPDEARIIKFLVDDRNVEVHESGSRRNVKTESMEIRGGFYNR